MDYDEEEKVGHVLDDAEEGDLSDLEAGTIEAYVMDRFNKAETARRTYQEQIWIKAFRNFIGRYGPDVQFTEAERSKVFIKITKTKSLAFLGQANDILFSEGKIPFSIDPTPLPEGVEEDVSFETDPQLSQVAEQTQQTLPPLAPGETLRQQKMKLGPLEEKLQPISGKLKVGTAISPTAVTFSPAEVASKKMQKTINDQFVETKAVLETKKSMWELIVFGTGVIKGPFAYSKEYPNWDEQGNYDPVYKTIPKVKHVSLWNLYPDPDATCVTDAEYICEVHPLSKSKLYALANRPFFREEVINQVASFGPDFQKEYWDHILAEDKQGNNPDLWKVIEFWGNVDVDLLEQHGIEVPDELKEKPQVSANIWVCHGKVIRCVLNPFTPSYIPYHVCPMELNPYSFWGVGFCENMDDTQTLMNGFLRMAVDNAALSGNLIIEIDETNLVPEENPTDIYPGKVFRRQGGAPGQAIFGTKFPNVANENLQLFDKARQLADESTGLPSFSHGQTGVSGVGRTSSGISMLMSAASVSVTSLVKNVDDYFIQPIVESFFRFNMQFNFDPQIKGDLTVKAKGVESLMADEVRSQRLLQFLQVVQNPVLAPFAKMDYIIREIAKSLKLDPEKVVNSMSDAALQAEIFKQLNPQPEITEEAPMGGLDPNDTQGTGGGTIGVGTSPTASEDGFTGTPQGTIQ